MAGLGARDGGRTRTLEEREILSQGPTQNSTIEKN